MKFFFSQPTKFFSNQIHSSEKSHNLIFNIFQYLVLWKSFFIACHTPISTRNLSSRKIFDFFFSKKKFSIWVVFKLAFIRARLYSMDVLWCLSYNLVDERLIFEFNTRINSVCIIISKLNKIRKSEMGDYCWAQ